MNEQDLPITFSKERDNYRDIHHSGQGEQEVLFYGLFAFQRGMTVSSSDQFGLPA